MVLARGRHVGSGEVELLQTLLEACGQCEEVPEAQVDIHTGLSGSGVAFVSVTCPALPSPSPPPPPPGQPSAKAPWPLLPSGRDGVLPAAHELGSPPPPPITALLGL